MIATLAVVMLSAAPPVAPVAAQEATVEHSYVVSDVLMWTTVAAGTIHLADHVLRDNHVSFPFKASVGPFTYVTFTVLPFLLGGALFGMGPLYWTVGDAVVLALVTTTHLLLEPPHDLHRSWTNRTNLLHVSSPALGVTSQVLTFSLSGFMAAHLVSSIRDGLRDGFTLRRRKPAPREAVSVTPILAPAPGGGTVGLVGTF